MLAPFYTDAHGTVLVRLLEQGEIETPDKQYKSYHKGKVVAIQGDVLGQDEKEYRKLNDYLQGNIVYFEEFKDTCQTEYDGELYAMILLNDIRGYENE